MAVILEYTAIEFPYDFSPNVLAQTFYASESSEWREKAAGRDFLVQKGFRTLFGKNRV